MTLRRKALLIIAITLVCLIGILYAVSRFVFIEGLLEIERNDTQQNVEQALAAFSDTLSQLEADTVDWAAWDDTYAFIESESNEYIESNLVDSTFTTLRLNLMLFIHSSGRIVFSKAFDLENEEEIPISPSLRKYFYDDSLSLSRLGTEQGTSGIILLDEGPMYIVPQPILTSEDEGPARGTLIFGRYLNASEIGRLSRITLFPINFYPISEIQMQADFQTALHSLSEEEPIFVQPLDDTHIAGYTLIKDIYGRPSLVMRVDSPRNIYQQGLYTVYSYVLAAVAVSLVVAAIAMLIAEKQVLNRFTRIVKDISNVTASRDPSDRLSVAGSDELGIIARTINGMLAALDESAGELRKLYEGEKELRQQLEEEISKRSEFTRALVHELKTPITPVMAASELLLEELKDSPLLGLVQSIDRSASNLNKRIDELLDLARVEVDMLQINPESIEPIQLFQEISYEMIPVALGNQQSLSLELPPSLPVVWADIERLRQIVINLLNNAFKFTPAGGRIILRVKEDGANLIVEVQDTGRGISKEEQERLFNPYYRIESDRERFSGLGLGLVLAKRFVELHGGQLWVKSSKGKGSTFSFSIPLAATNLEEKGGKPRGES